MAVQLAITPQLDGTVAVQVKVRNPRKPRVAPIILKESYTAEEITTMDNTELLAEWIRITGREMLGCKQCGKIKDENGEEKGREYPVTGRWVYSIRCHCMRHGMYAGMPVPGTCDNQRNYNDRTNKINNDFYRGLKKCKTDEERDKLREERDAKLHAIGIQTRPSRYRVCAK
jgi:hypothetical protein